MGLVNDPKYSDQDVRGYPDLYAAAVRFAIEYCGDFPFLVDANRMANGSGELPIAVARGVLNCMRADPVACQRLPRMWSGTPEHQVMVPAPDRRLRPVALQRRIRDLPCVWHYNFVLSMHPLAKTYHYLNQFDSIIRYNPHDYTFKCYPKGACGRAWYEERWLRMTNQPENYSDYGTRTLCKGCAKLDA